MLAGLVLVASAAGAVYAFATLEDQLDRERTQRASDHTYVRTRLDAMSAELATIASAVALGRGAPLTHDRAPSDAPGSSPAPSSTVAADPPSSHALRTALADACAARDQAAAELATAAGKLAFLERQLEMLSSARAAAERDRDELARQLALRVTAEASPTPPPRATEGVLGPALLALVQRIDEHLSHDPRTPRLRFVAARSLAGEAFTDVVLEERAVDGTVVRRITAARASFELYQALRLVRVRLATCHLAEDPASGGRELRLPELAVERYDVDVKSWRELARETTPVWLALR